MKNGFEKFRESTPILAKMPQKSIFNFLKINGSNAFDILTCVPEIGLIRFLYDWKATNVLEKGFGGPG